MKEQKRSMILEPGVAEYSVSKVLSEGVVCPLISLQTSKNTKKKKREMKYIALVLMTGLVTTLVSDLMAISSSLWRWAYILWEVLLVFFLSFNLSSSCIAKSLSVGSQQSKTHGDWDCGAGCSRSLSGLCFLRFDFRPRSTSCELLEFFFFSLFGLWFCDSGVIFSFGVFFRFLVCASLWDDRIPKICLV